MVHAANIHDTKGGISTARRAYERYPSIQKFCTDAGYRGIFVSDMKEQLDLGAGWLNAPSPGSIISGDSVKIMKFLSLPLRLWSTFLISQFVFVFPVYKIPLSTRLPF